MYMYADTRCVDGWSVCVGVLQGADRLGFRVGQRLEAIDKNNPEYICVASISRVDGMYVRVHFDGWEKGYDFWCRPNSPYIHPVGWCQEHGEALSPPGGTSPQSRRHRWP